MRHWFPERKNPVRHERQEVWVVQVEQGEVQDTQLRLLERAKLPEGQDCTQLFWVLLGLVYM